LVILSVGFLGVQNAGAEDGYRLWLRYARVEDPALLKTYKSTFSSVVVQGKTETDRAILKELQEGFQGLLGKSLPTSDQPQEGALIVETPQSSPQFFPPRWEKELQDLGEGSYVIRSMEVNGRHVTAIASESPVGCLYGAFHLLRLLGTHQPVENLDLSEGPKVKRRVLDHWDNLDGTIERGYAGKSLWKWQELPGHVDDRIRDYGRACASIGINGAVLNNVNADPKILTSAYLVKVAALADALRPYGMRVYLSANFGSPKALGDLPTADPLDLQVIAWWKVKADEIYKLIPDFGGFLVKANSEGQPGPNDYGRSHDQGANMLARALASHGGVVMWRAFVYQDSVDKDRIKRAYKEFTPLDGKFDPNVFIQVKNGPLDFQPREPFSPLFGAMPKTPLAAELQVTQEYLGHSTHLVYLGPLWKEFLDSDTYAKGRGSKVEKVVTGELDGHGDSLIAGVANTGDDRNWCGHPFAAANWYAFGRLAWDPSLDSQVIAQEWARLTWGNNDQVVAPIVDLMTRSREAYVDYTCPLGLNGVFEKDLHYAPDPGMVDPRREDWSAAYYTRADAKGLGFDRTRSGSDAVDQYHKPLPDRFNNFKTCPEPYLLWFHHVSWDAIPWDGKMPCGNTLWEELVSHYGNGVEKVRLMKQTWEYLKGKVDGERWGMVDEKLKQQVKEAAAWRDKCLKYFQGFSKKPIPNNS